MERKKLEIAINTPTQIVLLYDEPIIGESRYGDYYLYAVQVGDEQYSYFAPPEVHEQLQHLGKGEMATITKLAAQRGSKLITKWVVDTNNTNGKSKPQKPAVEVIEEPPIQQGTDRYCSVMLDCYRDAISIQEQLNGLVDVSRIAITLFIARSKINGNTINKIGD